MSGERCCNGRACAEGLGCESDEPARVEEQVLTTQEEVSGGWFGTSENRTYGGACGPDRLRSGMRTTKLSGDGNCDRSSQSSQEPAARHRGALCRLVALSRLVVLCRHVALCRPAWCDEGRRLVFQLRLLWLK